MIRTACFSILSIVFASLLISCAGPTPRPGEPGIGPQQTLPIDVSGDWEFRDEEYAQNVSLDTHGNGRYAWQKGHIETTSISNGHWRGRWYQEGNNREGGFDVELSPDASEAHGRWWYTRINDEIIEAGTRGGNFHLRRIHAASLPSP